MTARLSYAGGGKGALVRAQNMAGDQPAKDYIPVHRLEKRFTPNYWALFRDIFFVYGLISLN